MRLVVILSAVCLLALAHPAFGETIFTFDDIRRTGGADDNLFIAANEPLPGDIAPEIRVNAGSVDLQAQSDGMTNFITYFDAVSLDVGESIRATIDFELSGKLVENTYPLGFGLYHTNPDPEDDDEGRLLQDNFTGSDQKFIRYEGFGATFKPAEEAGEEETQRFQIRRANQQGSSANKFMDQNAQSTFDFDSVELHLGSSQRFIIEVLRTAEEAVEVSVALPQLGYQFTFDHPDYVDPATTFDAFGIRHGTDGEVVNPSVVTITSMQVSAIPEPGVAAMLGVGSLFVLTQRRRRLRAA